FPMCMVDRVIEYEDGKRAVGIKNLSFNEQFFQGHFPQEPVMPGVLQVEGLAQLAAWLILQEIDQENQIGYFASINEAKFRKPVVPGDQLRLEVEVIRKRRSFVRVSGKTFVGAEVASEGDISIMLGSNLT
ncbi:MAG: 3-hydroxyacyl-ACP dehydratase FabZ, partial [Candidatus Poribacteria bacterium]|nr:3-hydroxyacyl-ACP dehydratase FabZ [Candidatus Poribacteria bacterium]